MNAYSRSRSAFVLAWAMIAALACGSNDSNSSKKTGDGGSADFGNASGSSSGHSGGTRQLDSGSGPANSGSPPANSGSGALDAGAAMMADSGTGSAASGGGAPFDSGPLDASSDVSTNAEWVASVQMLADMAARPGCGKALTRDAQLDAVAQRLAEDPNATVDVTTKSMWKTISASTSDDVLALIRPYLDENAAICTWRAYGIGIVGQPGGKRRIALLLAE